MMDDTQTDAQLEIANAVRAVAETGPLTPQRVLAAARDTSNALHAQFEWDDAIAGEAYRIEQARTLVRSIKVEVRVIGGARTVIPRYVRDPHVPAAQAGYVEVTSLRDRGASRVCGAEIERVRVLIERGLGIAQAAGEEDYVLRFTALSAALTAPLLSVAAAA
jgi:hypothetical protein